MEWDEYLRRYNYFGACLGGSGVSSIISLMILNDFPNKLPKELAQYVIKTMDEFFKSHAKNDIRAQEILKKKSTVSISLPFRMDIFPESDLRQSLIHSSLFLSIGEIAMEQNLDWKNFLTAQNLVMIFAHFDAFFSDSIRAICESKPEILKREKKISWRNALELENQQLLIKHLTEEYVFELCHEDTIKRITILEKELGLKLDIGEKRLESIKNAQLIRNIVVHNGGRINAEFIRKVADGQRKLKIGDIVKIELDVIRRIDRVILFLGCSLFKEVSKKYFGMQEADLNEKIWQMILEEQQPNAENNQSESMK